MNQEESKRLLERLLASESIGSAPVCSKLLRFLFEANGENPDDPPTQYTLADHLYGSLEESDLARARRIAGELRKRLALYYAGEGADDEIRVELPRGRYQLRYVKAAIADRTDGAKSLASDGDGREPPAATDDAGGEAGASASPASPTIVRGGLALVLLLLLVALLLAYPHHLGLWGRGEPCGVQAVQSSLQVLDCEGRPTASHSFPYELKGYPPSRAAKLVDIEDLDGDGVDDLIVGTAATEQRGKGQIHILDGATREWIAHVPLRHTPEGAPIPYAREFVPFLIRVLHDEQGNPHSILASALSATDSLGYYLHLGLDGSQLGVLWTYGHPRDFLQEVDLDQDGDLEILVGVRHDDPDHLGTALMVLDRHAIDGYVPHPAKNDYFPPQAEAGGYLAYVLFPHSELTRPGEKNYIKFARLMKDEDLLQVMVMESAAQPTHAEIIYWLNRDLELQRIQLSDNYIRECAKRGCRPPEVQKRELSKGIRLFHAAGSSK